MFDILVAGSPGAIENLSLRGDLESMLEGKSIEPKSERYRRDGDTNAG